MAIIEPTTRSIRTGEVIVLRSAELSDAAAFLRHADEILRDPEFVSISRPEEFNLTETQEREWIRAHRDKAGDIVIVAEVDAEFIGLVFLESEARQRISHRGLLHMAISRPWRGRGVGTALLESLIQWAEQHSDLEKLCLEVMANNTRAIGLYKKLGFQEEGRRPRAIKLGPDEYLDDILMYRFV